MHYKHYILIFGHLKKNQNIGVDPLTARILRSMLGLRCNKTYRAMTNHDDGDDSGDKDRNEYWNDDDRAASGLGANGPIIYPITMPRSLLGLAEKDRKTMTIALRPWRPMYIRVWIYLPYKYPIHIILNMCHKLLYAKIGVLESCY